MTIVESRAVIGGVDTHADFHVAAALNGIGGLLEVRSFPTTPRGYCELLHWLESLGDPRLVGIEGTGSYGAGLARHLSSAGVAVVEVDRPNRKDRRKKGKSDALDAVSAARAALSGEASGLPRGRDGVVEAIRTLVVVKRSARNERIQTVNQARSLVLTGPEDLRARFKHHRIKPLVNELAALRPREGDLVGFMTRIALRELARRVQFLDAQLEAIDARLTPLVRARAPELLAVEGIGTYSASLLLVCAGDHPERLRSEAAFAHLCAAAPIPATSGKSSNHKRFNPGGDRQANHALWRIVVTRMSHDPRTMAYVERRSKEGLSKKEIIRCLKRYVAREVYPILCRAVA